MKRYVERVYVRKSWQSSGGMTLKALSVALLALAVCAPAGWAHTDPPGANNTATVQSLGVYSDAACTIPLTVIVGGAGSIAYLQATLNFSGSAGAASYELGRWRMEAAGSVIPASDPLVPLVPCIGHPGSSTDDPMVQIPPRGSCSGTTNMLVSSCIPYITTAADAAAGFVSFEAILGDPNPASPDTSYAHIGVNDVAGVSSSVPQRVLIQRCGDGNVNPGEECDDGNNVDGDGCSSACMNEVPTLGELGLIALASLLGLVSWIALRRRPVTG